MNTNEVNSEMQKAGQPIPSSEANNQQPVMNLEAAEAIIARTLSQPTDEELQGRERLELLRSLRIKSDTAVEPEQYALSVDGVGFFAMKDIHALKGKQKSGKSTILKWCAATLVAGSLGRVESLLKEPRVLFLDTEQQAADVRLVLDEVKRLSGVGDDYLDSHLYLYTLRRLNYDTLVQDTRMIIDHVRPQVVIIDGLVDYVDSFNDEVASRQLVHELLVMCDEFECAIVSVLHENKAIDDQNMRGHLGTVLAQKAGTVLQCQKRDDVITVTTSDARHGAMPQWSVTFDADGHLQQADELLQLKERQRTQSMLEKRQADAERRQQERIQTVSEVISEHAGRISRKDLAEALSHRLGIKVSSAYNVVRSMMGTTLHEIDNMICMANENALPF